MDIKRLAELSALYLEEDALQRAQDDLRQMLQFTEMLTQVQLQPTQQEDVSISAYRKRSNDLPTAFPKGTLLQNAPDSIDGFFRVPGRKEETDV